MPYIYNVCRVLEDNMREETNLPGDGLLTTANGYVNVLPMSRIYNYYCLDYCSSNI